ncbi:UNVERIFIED_CONTAM: LON peptidase N-terminal domain and RING finger protein 1 [Siphonaria sp. JEL0065]|nr:LON peptidase N-terminal domain and RING finger protein 1 [Siphonaria sp. JEL0065]
MSKLLHCTECGQILQQPVTLACGSSVCLSCYRHLALPCPVRPAVAFSASLFAPAPHAADLAPALLRCPSSTCSKRVHRRFGNPGVDVVSLAIVSAATTLSPSLSSELLLQTLQKEVECCLCCSLFVQPVTAPCGHTFCRQCAIDARNRCRPACPVCRKPLPNDVFFRKRPTNKLIAKTVEWVKACTDTPLSRPPSSLRNSPSSSALQCFINSLPRYSPTQPPSGPPKLPKNQFIIPIFVSCKTIMPGIPCFMQLFEPRYRTMIAKILEINQKRGDEDCQWDSMVYGVCIKVPEKGLPYTGIKRRRSNNDSINSTISTSTTMVDKDEVTVVRPTVFASSSSVSMFSSASSSSCATVFANTTCARFGRSVFSSGASCPNLPSTYSSAPPSPWIIPCHTRVGCTSEYMDFGTALKLRSIRPIFDDPPPDHDPSTPDACRSGVSSVTPAVGEVGAQSTVVSTAGRTSSSSSTDTTNSSEYDYDDEDDEMDIDEDEEWGSQEGGDGETPLRSHSQLTNGSRRSSNRPNSSASHSAAPRSSPRAAATESPLPVLPNHQQQQQQQAQNQQQQHHPTAELSRYLVDGIGSWRFKVLERGVCDDGLNLALVERLEDLDFEDEECAGLDIVNAALAEKEDATDSPLSRPLEVCTMSECDCAASKRPKLSTASTPSTMDTLSTTKYQDASSMDYTHGSQLKGITRCTPTSSTSTTSATSATTPDTDNNYTCPMSEFFKSTHLSSFAKCMYSGVQYLACTKQPPFPFDIDEVTPLKLHDTPTTATTTNLIYSHTQNEYLQSLYTRLSTIVQEITTHLNTTFLNQQESTTSSITTAYANALHFKLIHGDVPSCTPNTSEAAEHLTYWVTNLLDLSEVCKNEILRHDLGGVDGRVEWVLGVVEEMRRLRGSGGQAMIGDLLKVKF